MDLVAIATQLDKYVKQQPPGCIYRNSLIVCSNCLIDIMPIGNCTVIVDSDEIAFVFYD